MRRIFKYILTAVSPALAVILTFTAPIAFAESQQISLQESATASIGWNILQDATTKIEQSHDELLNIRDADSLSESERATKEISARKNIVSSAISLSLVEINSLKDTLLKLPEFEDKSAERTLRNEYLEELDLYSEYYDGKTTKLAEVDTMDGVKVLAKEISDYRAGVYNPAIQRIADFSLIFYNENAIDIASSRLNKIVSDIKRLEKLNLFKTAYVKTRIDKASDLIRDSREKHVAARELVMPRKQEQYDSEVKMKAGESQSSIKIGIEGKIATKLTAREFIEGSLGDIKSAYDIFLQISYDVRKSLGLR